MLRLRQRLAVSARARPAELPPNLQRYADTGEALIAEPFRGITADGRVVPRLFPIERTGVSARPVQDAAEAFLAPLGPEQTTGLHGRDLLRQHHARFDHSRADHQHRP